MPLSTFHPKAFAMYQISTLTDTTRIWFLYGVFLNVSFVCLAECKFDYLGEQLRAVLDLGVILRARNRAIMNVVGLGSERPLKQF